MIFPAASFGSLGRAARLAPEDPTKPQLDKREAILAPARVAETAPLFASLLSTPSGGRYPPLALSAAQQPDSGGLARPAQTKWPARIAGSSSVSRVSPVPPAALRRL